MLWKDFENGTMSSQIERMLLQGGRRRRRRQMMKTALALSAKLPVAVDPKRSARPHHPHSLESHISHTAAPVLASHEPVHGSS